MVDVDGLGALGPEELGEAVEGVIARMATGRASAVDGLVVGEMARRWRVMREATQRRSDGATEGSSAAAPGIAEAIAQSARCVWCHGSGTTRRAASWVKCSACGGSGRDHVPYGERCDACGGTGTIGDGHHGHAVRCERCGGKGV